MHLLDRLRLIWHSPEMHDYLEDMIMSASADYAARLDAVTNAIAADLREAQAKGDAEWSAALDGPISRLEAMGQNTDDPAADSDGTVPDAGSDSDEPTA